MAIIVVCAALLVMGVVAAARWGGRAFAAVEAGGELSPVETARRFVWYAALVLTGGVFAGITVIGAGGRLAMRLLAVTAGDGAQGRITEAEEIVGRITLDGTIGFVLFNGIFGGILAAALYLVVRRFLPPGRLGGAAFGLGLLIVVGTTIDPLRRENPDFDIVGPGWLAVVVFGAMAVVFGVTLAAVLARLSEWLPLLTMDRRVLVRYAAPAPVAVLAFPVTVALVAGCIAVVAVTRFRPLVDAVRSRRWVVGGRVVTLGLVGVALPHSLSSVIDIATR
ncbi:MAG TPA: hypothetical protein VG034_19325 [Acidimicrobiia bacterium]|jgi:hypothetical protein|nr:hypothetical protein [Acidimicrobiia bacterium]